MKKFFVTLAAAFISAASFAQVVNSTFVSHNGDSEARWSINLLGVNACSSESNFDFRLHHTDDDFGTPGFYFGISNMSSNDFDLKPGNSLEFGFTPIDFAWWNNRRNFGIVSGVGISWTRYAFKENVCIGKLTPGSKYAVYPLDGTGNSKSRVTYASWRVPVEFAFASRNSLATIGVEGELRHHVRNRTKFEDPISGKVTKRHHYVSDNCLGVNPWGVNAVASIGTHGVSLFGRMALTEFFDKDETDLSGTPFMVGIRFYNL